MALTKISDIFLAAPFSEYTSQRMLETSRFIKSGILTPDAVLNAFAAGPGQVYTVPSWNQLANEESNASSDDEATDAVPKKITTAEQVALKQCRNEAWQGSDIAAGFAGSDPLVHVMNNVADFWVKRLEAITLASLEGVMQDNITNDAGDMVYDVTATSGVFTDAGFIEAVGTMGDHQSNLAAIVVHSTVYTTMRQAQLIDYVRSADNNTLIATYQGMDVYVDDEMTVVSGGYRSIIFARGAVGLGTGLPKVPSEMDRNILGGNGGGIETIIDRKDLIVHPYGFAWTGAAGGVTPSITTLKAAASWNRVLPRKAAKIAYYITTG